MGLDKTQIEVIRSVLAVEHSAVAQKLELVSSSECAFTYSLLLKTVELLDELSRSNDNYSKKVVVTVSGILWEYRKKEWDGLKEFLILILSRCGYSPSGIMIDRDYNKVTDKFSPITSIINEFSITLHQLRSEIVIGDIKILLTELQKNIWEKLGEVRFLGISAPTSAGKSFVISLKVVDVILKRKGDIIYIVPTLSLVSQVCSDINAQLKKFGIKNYRIKTTYSLYGLSENNIYVLTQEKAISAFSQSDSPYKEVSLIVVDEIQNIEKVANEGDQRAKTLYDILIELRYACNPYLTIVSGPRVEGLSDLGAEVFDIKERDEVKTSDSPVVSITYSISERGGQYFFNQYSGVLDKHEELLIDRPEIIKGFGKSQYSDDFLNYLSRFISQLGSESRNIIFQPTTTQARKTALRLAGLRKKAVHSRKLDSLVSYIKETVHEDYNMCEAIPKGFVYHHGKTPSHVRVVVEHAIRDRLISNVVCTTTLMQGVNLPAQNVILRNPYLAIKKVKGVKPRLTDYEIANLRGRAGRLLKDFIGRTFVLEENSFEQGEHQAELFPEAEKRISGGYGSVFRSHRDNITEDLVNDISYSDESKQYAFLLTHIRQVVIKHKNEAMKRLRAVGIELTDSELQEVSDSVAKLSVPREVCYKNRYWDPIDLDRLFKQSEEFSIPLSVYESGIENQLYVILEKMRIYYGLYYKRHLNIDSLGRLKSLCISAKSWMREKPLRDILSGSYFDSADKIEERISLLYREISYGVPMLLKPLYDIKSPDNMFLRFIEIGSHDPLTRKMIELNIPRETAIELNNEYFRDFQDESENIHDEILLRLRRVLGEVDYWRRVQIESVV